MRRGIASALLVLHLAVACSSGEEHAGPSADTQAEARAIQQVLADTTALAALTDVDEAIRDDRPALAADLIARGAIPETERQIRVLETLEIGSADGRRFRTRAIRLHRDRLRALALMQTAFARGAGHEDSLWMDAIHADSEAQVALVHFEEELMRIAPLPEQQESNELEQRGLPPMPSRDVPLEEALEEHPGDPNPGAAEPIAIPPE
jgi:hypothetical protein